MIKLATNINDVMIIIPLMQEFLLETSYDQALEASRDREHLGKIATTMIKNGYVWLAFVDGQPAGLLMSVVEKNMWSPKDRQLREILWFVRKPYRKSTVGGRLFAEYCAQGEKLLEQGQIQGYFTTKMTTTDDINLEKRGFRLTEKTYLKER